MITKMSAREARDNFSDLLGSVYYGKQPVAVEKKGKVVAIVVNPKEYDMLLASAKARFFDVVERIQERNKDKTEEEVMADVTKAVEEVRQANYDRQHKKGRI